MGDVVDDVFRIDEELDHGNFGAVYKVVDLLEKRTLALKVLKPGPHDEDELRQRFEREARLIYSLNHPHVIDVFYYGETESKLPYMAMEYLYGTDLKALLRHHGGLSDALTRRIAIESLSALHTAHHEGIIHRDLKPANIYLVDDGAKGHVKVLDFGFAKALGADKKSEITNAGTLVGTPAYMSPELVHKKDVGPPADIYAMGLILAEMLAGKKVVQISSIYDTIIFQGSEKPIKLSDDLNHSAFGPILRKSIAKDLDQRYSTALEMIDALRELDLEGTGPYTDDVPLTTAPPEVGDADMEASTRPRSDGRPSMEQVDAALDDELHVADFSNDDPTVDQSQRSSKALPNEGEVLVAYGSDTADDIDVDNPTIPYEMDDNPTDPLDVASKRKSLQSGRHNVDSGPLQKQAPDPRSLDSGPHRDRVPSPDSGSQNAIGQQGSPSTGQAHDSGPHQANQPNANPRDSRPHQPVPADAPSAPSSNERDIPSTKGMEAISPEAPSRDHLPTLETSRDVPGAGADQPSALRDIAMGVVVGAVILAAILFWLSSQG